jgi:hypothetical protein
VVVPPFKPILTLMLALSLEFKDGMKTDFFTVVCENKNDGGSLQIQKEVVNKAC